MPLPCLRWMFLYKLNNPNVSVDQTVLGMGESSMKVLAKWKTYTMTLLAGVLFIVATATGDNQTECIYRRS